MQGRPPQIDAPIPRHAPEAEMNENHQKGMLGKALDGWIAARVKETDDARQSSYRQLDGLAADRDLENRARLHLRLRKLMAIPAVLTFVAGLLWIVSAKQPVSGSLVFVWLSPLIWFPAACWILERTVRCPRCNRFVRRIYTYETFEKRHYWYVCKHCKTYGDSFDESGPCIQNNRF